MNELNALVVDDMPDIRMLMSFMLSASIKCKVTEAASGEEAWTAIQNNKYDIVVTDNNMPNGSGIELYQKIRSTDKNTPIVICSGDDPEKFKDILDDRRLSYVAKPFTDSSFAYGLQSIMPAEYFNQKLEYLPISLELLASVRKIHVPLYIQLSDDKFVKVTHQESLFDDDEWTRFKNKGLDHLYIETVQLPLLLQEYQSQILTTAVWNETRFEDTQKLLNLNTEIMRKCHSMLGWNPDILSRAQEGTQKALHLVAKNAKFSQILLKFQKIEKYGFSDRCTLTNLVCTQIANKLQLSDLESIQLNFAVLLHDCLLVDHVYEQKHKHLELIAQNKILQKETRDVFEHPQKTAELAATLNTCPKGTDIIILQHHEKPDGSGFPNKLTAEQIHKLAAILIVAEDFVNYFIARNGIVEASEFINSRSSLYSHPKFKQALDCLFESK